MEADRHGISWKLNLLLSGLLVVFGVMTGVVVRYVVPQFEELFAGFEVELPFYTDWVLATYRYYAWVAVLGVIAGAVVMLRELSVRQSYYLLWFIIGGFGLVVLVFLFTLFAMYVSIFQLGGA